MFFIRFIPQYPEQLTEIRHTTQHKHNNTPSLSLSLSPLLLVFLFAPYISFAHNQQTKPYFPYPNPNPILRISISLSLSLSLCAAFASHSVKNENTLLSVYFVFVFWSPKRIVLVENTLRRLLKRLRFIY